MATTKTTPAIIEESAAPKKQSRIVAIKVTVLESKEPKDGFYPVKITILSGEYVSKCRYMNGKYATEILKLKPNGMYGMQWNEFPHKDAEEQAEYGNAVTWDMLEDLSNKSLPAILAEYKPIFGEANEIPMLCPAPPKDEE